MHAFLAKEVLATNRFEAATALGLSIFIGRQSELQLLLERWTQAKEGEGQVVLLDSDPGTLPPPSTMTMKSRWLAT